MSPSPSYSAAEARCQYEGGVRKRVEDQQSTREHIRTEKGTSGSRDFDAATGRAPYRSRGRGNKLGIPYRVLIKRTTHPLPPLAAPSLQEENFAKLGSFNFLAVARVHRPICWREAREKRVRVAQSSSRRRTAAVEAAAGARARGGGSG